MFPICWLRNGARKKISFASPTSAEPDLVIPGQDIAPLRVLMAVITFTPLHPPTQLLNHWKKKIVTNYWYRDLQSCSNNLYMSEWESERRPLALSSQPPSPSLLPLSPLVLSSPPPYPLTLTTHMPDWFSPRAYEAAPLSPPGTVCHLYKRPASSSCSALSLGQLLLGLLLLTLCLIGPLTGTSKT